MIKAAHPSFGGQDAKLDGAGEVGIQAFVQHTADKPACKGVPGAGVIVQLVLIELFVAFRADFSSAVPEAENFIAVVMLYDERAVRRGVDGRKIAAEVPVKRPRAFCAAS